jgi:hypothetical protein
MFVYLIKSLLDNEQNIKHGILHLLVTLYFLWKPWVWFFLYTRLTYLKIRLADIQFTSQYRCCDLQIQVLMTSYALAVTFCIQVTINNKTYLNFRFDFYFILAYLTIFVAFEKFQDSSFLWLDMHCICVKIIIHVSSAEGWQVQFECHPCSLQLIGTITNDLLMVSP